MTLQLWQLILAAFAVAAVFTTATAWVIGKPTYTHGYKQAADDIAQALITVRVVAERHWKEQKPVDFRQIVGEMRLVPLLTFQQHQQDHFEFVATAESLVKSATRKGADDAR